MNDNAQKRLGEIAGKARLLADMYPVDAENYRRELQSLKCCRENGDSDQDQQTIRHALKAWETNCEHCRVELTKLVEALHAVLPEVAARLVLVRILPGWRYGDENTDWEGIKRELRIVEDAALAAIARNENALLSEPAGESETIARMLTMMDENTPRIMTIAADTSLSADRRMREICTLDQRYYGKNSVGWATVLNVSSAAIRGTDFWKVDRKRLIGDAATRYREQTPDGKVPD